MLGLSASATARELGQADPCPGSRGPRGPTRKGPREGFRVVSVQQTQPRPYKKRVSRGSSGTPTLGDPSDPVDLAEKIAGGAY
jgi:hypothetical protein